MKMRKRFEAWTDRKNRENKRKDTRKVTTTYFYDHEQKGEVFLYDDRLFSKQKKKERERKWKFSSAYLVLFVLSGVWKAWNDGRHSWRGCNFACIYHDQQLHEIIIDLTRAWLNDVDVFAAHRFADLDTKKKRINLVLWMKFTNCRRFKSHSSCFRREKRELRPHTCSAWRVKFARKDSQWDKDR